MSVLTADISVCVAVDELEASFHWQLRTHTDRYTHTHTHTDSQQITRYQSATHSRRKCSKIRQIDVQRAQLPHTSSVHSHHRLDDEAVRVAAGLRLGLDLNNKGNVYIAVIMAQSHGKSSPGSFHECRTTAVKYVYIKIKYVKICYIKYTK